jgi:hypothetical protein
MIDPEHSELMHPNDKYIELFGLDNIEV